MSRFVPISPDPLPHRAQTSFVNGPLCHEKSFVVTACLVVGVVVVLCFRVYVIRTYEYKGGRS